MKITLTFPSHGDALRHIMATWLPVGNRAGGDQEVTRLVGHIAPSWVGAVVVGWVATLNTASGPLTLRRGSEDEARRAVCDYLENHGAWWFMKRDHADNVRDTQQ